MSRRLLAAIYVGLIGVVLSAQTPTPQTPGGTGLIVGQVVDAVTGRGIGDAAVTLVQVGYQRPGGNLANSRPVLADSDGNFVFRGVPAGTWQITARRSGYAESLYGAVNTDGEGKSITLGDGGRFGDAKVKLWKLGAIGGTVVDDAGEPIVGLQVRAFKRNLVGGRWKFGEYYSNIRHGARTDDRGIYRISDIEPGDYIVSIPLTSAVAPASAVAELELLRSDPSARAAYTAANEAFTTSTFATTRLPVSRGGTSTAIAVGDLMQTLIAPGLAPITPATGPWLMYQTTFHPATSQSSSALPITMKAGQDVSGIDFALKPVRTFRVSGRVSGLGNVAAVSLRLVVPDAETVLDETEVAATLSAADGSFTFVGVPSGNFVIKVLRAPVPARLTTQIGTTVRSEQAEGVSMEPTLWATVPIGVGGNDVSGVDVALNNGVRATGRLVFDGARAKPAGAQLAGVEITIESAGGEKPVTYNTGRFRPGSEAFQTPELTPGKYIIGASAPNGWFLKSINAGSRDVRDRPLVVDGSEIPPITVTYTDRALGALTGTVRTVAKLMDPHVCVFPVEREAWVDYGDSPRRLRRVQANQTNAYRVADIPAGEYFVVAIADDRPADWRDPKHLEALSKTATRVTLADYEARTIDLLAERPAASVVFGELDNEEVTHAVGSMQQAPPRSAPRATPQPTGTAALAGVVTAESSNAPIRRAIVLLNSTDPKVGRTALTDDSGRFSVTDLPAARYRLNVVKAGYLDFTYGATQPGRPGTLIALGDGERSSIAVKMTKAGVISGTIRDARGEPVAGVAVSLNRYDFINGERRLNAVGRSAPTDDRGQYRVYDLEPGDYYVNVERANVGFYRSLRQTTAQDLAAAKRELSANAPVVSGAPAADSLPEMGYAPVFYPGSTLFSQAASVAVRSGEERGGIDIALQLVPLARIQARVVGPDGQTPAMVQGRLVPQTQLPGMSLTGLETGPFRVITDGRLEITGIPPGDYTLHVGGSTVAPPPMVASGGGAVSPVGGALGLPMWAAVPVTIDGRNVDGLSIQLQLGKQMTGRVVFEGTTTLPASVALTLAGPQLGGATLSRPGAATPEFSIDGIIPGAYRVLIPPTVRGWTIKSAVFNGSDAADVPVDISTDVSGAVITLTDKLTELSGVLQTAAGTPATSFFVIVFARDSVYWFNGSRRIVSLRPASDGRFVTAPANPLPPGEYYIAAVTDVRSGEWFDPAFLKTLTTSAITISLGEGEKKRQDLKIK